MDSNSFHGITRQKIALLIDFDNVILGIEDPGFDVEIVVNALRERGLIVMGRAYGDWYRHNRHRRRLMEQGIDLIETPVFGPIIKNSADMHMALDAFEVAITQPHIDTFCIVSGDSDFLPLIKRLQSRDKMVIVVAGHRFTSELVRRNCNEYLAYENLLAESVGATEDVTTIEGAYQLLHRTIDTLQERDIEVRSSTVKQMMVQLNPAFSERNFGCHQFKQFLDRAARAQIVTLNPRHGMAGESIVLLNPESEIQNVETPRDKAPRETFARDNRAVENRSSDTARNSDDRNKRGRGRRSDERIDDKPTREELPAPETKTEAAPIEAAPAVEPVTENESVKSEWNDPNSMLGRVPLRRGRLRYSAREGRTLLNRPASPPNIEEAAKAEAAPAEETTTEAVSATTATPETTAPDSSASGIAASEMATDTSGETGPVETGPESSEEAEQKLVRKRSTRGARKRKAAEAANAEAANAEVAHVEATEANSEEAGNATKESQSAPDESTPSENAPEVEVASSSETESEAPKKKTRSRRKTSATKKAEAANAEAKAAEANTEAAPSAEATSASDEAIASTGETAPKPKRRRRTTTKKTTAPAENAEGASE